MNFENDFQKGVSALEDLYTLGGASITPVINRVYYHLFNLNNEIHTSSMDDMPQMKHFISRSVVEMTRDYLSFNSGYRSVDFNVINDSYTLDQWNRLLDVLPSTLAIINSFAFHDQISINFHERGLEICGNVEISDRIEEVRSDIYRNLRIIFKKSSMLTFKIEPTHDSTLQKMTLFLDISYTRDQIYSVDMSDDYGSLTLGLPNIFANYIAATNSSIEHTVLEITDNLELVRHSSIPDQNDLSKQVIHFSFLFRPVSIIIPKRGKLLPIEALRAGACVGRGEKFSKFNKASFYYIDFFSIMSR